MIPNRKKDDKIPNNFFHQMVPETQCWTLLATSLLQISVRFPLRYHQLSLCIIIRYHCSSDIMCLRHYVSSDIIVYHQISCVFMYRQVPSFFKFVLLPFNISASPSSSSESSTSWPRVNYTKDWVGLVWSGKGFHLSMDAISH